MAEKFKVGEFPDTANRGAFYSVMSAIASNDPERIIRADDDCKTVLLSIGSTLNTVADYLYVRAQHPNDVMFATDKDVADTILASQTLLAVLWRS